MKKFLTICAAMIMLTTPVEVYADSLNYATVAPCRIIDTRISKGGAGPIRGGTQRDILVADLCNVPFGPAKAIMINVLAVNVTGPGYLTVFAYGAEKPLISVLNYSSVSGLDAISNGVIIPICDNETQSCGRDLSIYAYTTTDVVVDVMGYFYPDISYPSLRILQPTELSLQSSTNINVVTNVYTNEDLYAIDSNGAGVKFILDGGLISGGEEYEDVEAPFEATFSNVIKMEHIIRTVVIDDFGMEINGFATEHQLNKVGVGDYYVAFGDSITYGYGDDVSLDDISLDLRNTMGGYEPILNDLLTAAKGYPHTVLNEGVGGEKSIDGAARIQSVIDAHPDAQYFLILFGTNDSSPSLPVPSGVGPGPPAPGTFEYNMQQIIDVINPVGTGKIPILAKVPMRFGDWTSIIPYSDPESHPKNLLIEEYNAVIDELKSLNPMIEVMTGPPDQSDNFFTYFRDLPRQNGIPIEFNDYLHPNGIGYQSMADLWLETLTE